MQNALFDRRRQRSQDRDRALALSLDAARTNASIEALVLADERGSVLASSGDRAVCAELGMTVPMMSAAPFGLRSAGLLRGGQIRMKAVSVGARSLWLAAVGDDAGVLDLSAHAVQRILSQS